MAKKENTLAHTKWMCKYHMLVSIPPKISVSSFMGYLKGKSALMIFDRHANLKYKLGNRHFWAEGYYVLQKGKVIYGEERKYTRTYKMDVQISYASEYST